MCVCVLVYAALRLLDFCCCPQIGIPLTAPELLFTSVQSEYHSSDCCESSEYHRRRSTSPANLSASYRSRLHIVRVRTRE
jgi:hypothetical protein